ncbi:MAG: S8 family serine peptidase [Deltaproteobacteria bacterium]|nr:S8 family serine peptidase [Deltaproteobacteria bacterium]
MNVKRYTLLLLVFLVCYCIVSRAQEKIQAPLDIQVPLANEPQPNSDALDNPKFVAGELILKFKHDQGEEILSNFAKDPILKRILQAHPLEYSGRIFPEFKTRDALQNHVNEIKNKFPERSKRIYDTSVPDLQRYFILVFRDKKTPVESLAREFMASENIEFAEPDYIGTLDTLPVLLPNDPYFSSQNSWGQGLDDLWGLHIINAPEAWQIEHGKSGKITIAVIDGGFDWTGNLLLWEELGPNVWTNTSEEPAPRNHRDDDRNGYVDDYFGVNLEQMNPNSPLPYDGGTVPYDNGSGHGTLIAGIIAAKGNNAKGIVGMM